MIIKEVDAHHWVCVPLEVHIRAQFSGNFPASHNDDKLDWLLYAYM